MNTSTLKAIHTAMTRAKKNQLLDYQRLKMDN